MDQFSDEPAAASESTYGAPADFNQEEFLNMSTAYFKMLQKAWDSGDMDDLANYTTDDLFIELTHKRREIKGANLTEIVIPASVTDIGVMDGLDGRTGIISYKRNVIVTPEGCPAWNWAVETGATVKSPEEN